MENNKFKAILYLMIIYLPIMYFVWYFDKMLINWIFNSNFDITQLFNGTLISILLKIFCLYVQLVVFYFYYRCLIGIYKIFNNHKDFFLK